MEKRPTYEELEQEVKELEKEVVELKQVEEEVLLHTEIVENMAEGAYLIRTSDGVIVYANKTFERMLGYDPGELVNKHVSIVNAPSEKSPEEIANDIIQSLKEKGTWSGEVRNIKKDGTPFWCHANVSTFDHHDFGEVWVSVHQDIGKRKKLEEELKKHRDHLEELVEERTAELGKTNEKLKREIGERKQVEEALRQSEERLRHVVQNMPVMLDALDEDNRILIWNRECERVTGYTAEEMIGASNVMEILYPDKEYLSKLLTEWAERGDEFYNWEMDITCKDGTTRTVAWSNISKQFPIPGWKSWAIGVDNTERKKAEQALREREAELEIKTNSLEEMNTALRVLLKRRDEDKRGLEEKVLVNVKELVVPFLEKVKRSRLDPGQTAYIDILESNLNDIISPFFRSLSTKYLNLTPTEIRVAHLIKDGKTTKEIAEVMTLSPRTIEAHRDNMRKKLGIKDKKANLRSHLLSIQ